MTGDLNNQPYFKREHPLTVRISFDTYDTLKREAREDGKTVSTLVNDILRHR